MAPSWAVITVAGVRVLVVAEELTGDRFALDAGHQEAGRAERVVSHGVHLRDRHSGPVRGLKQPVLQLPRHEVWPAPRVGAEDEGHGLGAAVGMLDHSIEGPRLAGGAAGEQAQVADVRLSGRGGGAGGRRRARRRVLRVSQLVRCYRCRLSANLARVRFEALRR